MSDNAIVIRPEFAPGRRIIAISDIHGNLPFLQNLLRKIRFTQEDILILLGDMLEKGPDNLALASYIMDLCNTHTVYPICGNCDGLVLNFFRTDALDESFFVRYLPNHPESCIFQMADRMGYTGDRWDFPALRSALNRGFPHLRDWLATLPTILETEHLVFVHGGVPSLEHMEQFNRWKCMKNDNFRGQGHSFDKYVIVGHWPVTLYHEDIPSAAPIFDWEQKIISIDGGCVLKIDGQLNALILPSEDSEDFSWQAWDGLPVYTALDSQEASQNSLNIRWGRSQLEMLEPGNGAGHAHPQFLSPPHRGYSVVRGLHRLPPACLPGRSAVHGILHQPGIPDEKGRRHRLVYGPFGRDKLRKRRCRFNKR